MLVRLVLKLLRSFGINVERTTTKNRLVEILSFIKPVATQIELIRVGGSGDGGYLIPNDLEGIKYLFSPGVSSKSLFEIQLVKFSMEAFLCDYSVETAPSTDPSIHFLKKHLGSEDNEKYIRFETWFSDCIGTTPGDCLLQMDIEGAEFEQILSIPTEILLRFRILVVEFHNLELIGSLFGERMIGSTFRRLSEYFHIVHVHPNNCCPVVRVSGLPIHPVIEVSFLRKDRAFQVEPLITGTHQLDRPNVASSPPIELSREWYLN